MAVENPYITATCVGATEFPDLVRLYQVTGVPKTVTDRGAEVLGGLPEDMFVPQVIQSEGNLKSGDL